MSKLQHFLENKPLFYKAFDPLRMKNAYQSIKADLQIPKIIHIIGTNGKGSTGRYLAQMLRQNSMRVGHYTSPHIRSFNERFWLDGKEMENQQLELAHGKLISLLDKQWQESLSYFEYTTLLAMIAFEDCEYVVLEAGLGGEHDATAVFENLLTVVTPIGMDHQAFLGSTIEAVARTKLNAIQKAVVLSKQEESLVNKIATKISSDKGVRLIDVNSYVFQVDDEKLIASFATQEKVAYLVENFKTALVAFRQLSNSSLDVSSLKTIFGRLTRMSKNVTVDVGHNLLAAGKILEHFGKSKVVLVYNSLEDKEYRKILTLLRPILLEVHIIAIEDERAVNKRDLTDVLDALNLPYQRFETIEEDKEYLVFGSFTVVEAFLKRLNG